MKKVLITICSREKRRDERLLSASERYLGDHVAIAKSTAEKAKKDFYILSGLYGLISADQKIPFYDYFLEEKAVEPLVKKVKEQLKDNNIGEIEFYTKLKWVTYNQVITKAAESLGINLKVVKIG